MKGRLAALAAAVLGAVALLGIGGPAAAAPASVTLVGDLEHLVSGCGDWDPSCASAHMVAGSDGVSRFSLALPSGDWNYKVAIADSWDENYGAHAAPGGDNISLHLGAATTVHFYY